jgi:predicted dehydrogenase
VISTPHHLHAEQGIAALERGLHVLMEKPMALTSADAWKLVDAAERANRVLMVGYNRRFMGMWRTLKLLLDDNGIGQLRQINLQMALYRRLYWEGKRMPEVTAMLKQLSGWPEAFRSEWETGSDWHASAAESGGGMFSNSGAHFVDLILWLSGSYATEVVAFSDNAGMPAECILNIQARLANGVLVSISSADVEPGGFAGQGTLGFIGDEGIVSYDLARRQEMWLVRSGQREALVPTEGDNNAAAAFVAAVVNGEKNEAPPHEGAYAVAFSEAVYRSAAENKIIKIDYPPTHRTR